MSNSLEGTPHKTDELDSSSQEEEKPVITDYVIQEYDSKIKFRTLNNVQNFLFFKNKNSIQVLEPIRLIYLYSFHHNDTIVDFAVAKDSSLILCSTIQLEIYKLATPNLSDCQIKIKYQLYKSVNVENLQNISVSELCDVIVSINKHRIIKIFDMDLNLIKAINLEIKFIPKEIEMFPLNFFGLNYDTKTIQLCKYNLDKLSFVYKITGNNPDLEDNDFMGEKPSDYGEKIIYFKENIIYTKEYYKNFSMYINYQDSSIMFVLTQGLNFLILQKVYELDNETYNLIPNLRTLLYINLSNQNEIENDKYISFSLLYDYENPYINVAKDEIKDLRSGIVDMDSWISRRNKNTLSENESGTFLNYNEKYFKNISRDYIIFNFQDNVIMYKVSGLQSPPFNNPSIDGFTFISTDQNYENNFTLIRALKTIDRKYTCFFIDKYNNIRKFILYDKNLDNKKLDKIKVNENQMMNNISLNDSFYTFTLYKNIINAEYNPKNRKTFIHQKIGDDHLIVLVKFRLTFFKMFIFEDIQISHINWINNSNFLIFSYHTKETPLEEPKEYIGIIYIYSKYFDKQINRLDYNKIRDNFIQIKPEQFAKKDIKNIYNIFIQTNAKENDNNQNEQFREDEYSSYSFDDVSSLLLIKGDNKLYCLYLKLTKNENKEKKSISEFKCELSLNYTIDQKNVETLSKKDKWKEKQFIFNQNEIFFTSFNEVLRILSIIKLDKNLKSKIIYQSVTIGNSLKMTFFFNNYIIYLTEYYINTYDINNRTFYRLRNDYVQKKEIEDGSIKVHLSFFGVYLCLSLLSSTGINIFRIPRNKNKNEMFSFKFKYKFQIGDFSKINYNNKMIIFNENQMETINVISDIKQTLLNESSLQQLILLNSNASSLFDNETFYDYFLSDNERIIKTILNIFCYEFKTLKLSDSQDKYRNSKLIPNFLGSVDFIKKLIFDEDIHCKITNDEKYNILSFKNEEDTTHNNPIEIMGSKNSNISHMKYVYDLLANDSTRNIDNFSKYFMLKMYSKKNDFMNKKYKLSTVDLCWISLISNQTDILDFIYHGKKENITWEIMTTFNIPLWIKSEAKLKELLIEVAKNNYKKQITDEAKNMENKTHIRNYTENIALYLYLADQNKMIYDYYDKEPHNEKIKKFVMRDFKIKKNRNAAHENADALMNKKKYIYAAYFYLLADDIRSALDMVYEKLRDINLTVCMVRLVNSPIGNDSWKKYYSLEKIYKDLFINFGTVFRDPYLITFGYIGQGKYDLALEYLLNYDNEYFFDDNKEIFQDIDDYVSNLKILSKSFALNVFDYRMILFAKSLEKIYQIKYDETNQSVQNVGNTGFDEDEWDMDNIGKEEEEEEEEIKPQEKNNVENTNTNEYKLKKIDINYDNLINLCLINSLRQGNLYTPIVYLFKTTHKNGFKDLPKSIKDILRSLISDRIVLDTIYSPPSSNIEKFFIEIDKFLDFLEQEGIYSKIEMYKKINHEYILLHEYQNSYLTSTKSNQIVKTLISIHDYVELIVDRNSYIIATFNFFQNINMQKINANLNYLLGLFCFIRQIENDYKEPTNEKEAVDNIEKNIYIFRIVFIVYFYLLFVNKVVMKYKFVTDIYNNIQKLVDVNYKNIANFNGDAVINYIDDIFHIISKVKKIIKNETTGAKKIFIDEGLSFYIQFLNLAIIKKITAFLEENKTLRKISNSEKVNLAKSKLNNSKNNINKNENKNIINDKNKESEKSDHYFYEDFNFINFILNLTYSYLDNFDISIEKYIEKYLKVEVRYALHDELVKTYIKKTPINFAPIGKNNNNKIIKYEYLFGKNNEKSFNDKISKFENLFDLRPIICKYITFISKKFKYEKLAEGASDSPVNAADQNLPPSNYTNSSIQVVSSLFHNVGYDIATLNESLVIQDFCFNNCDFTQMALSMKNQGNMKINILNNLINKNRNEDDLLLTEKDELENWEQVYKNSNNYDYFTTVEERLQNNYSELLSIIYHGILLPRKTFIQFPLKLSLPPQIFNSIPSETYLENISTITNTTSINTVTTNTPGTQPVVVENQYSKFLCSHPQLPLFLSSNNKGILSVYSFGYEKDINNPIDEYFVEKNSNESGGKYSHVIKRMKFNSYGDNILACDVEGNLFNWGFDHIQASKTPKNIFNKSETFCCDDSSFLNNTGILVTTCNKKDEKQRTCLFDLLLPPKKRQIGELYGNGGNFTVPISSDASFMIVNDKPGNISFVDIRRMSIVKEFQAHQNVEIKDIKISENENFLITYGDDLFVKIWDLSNKTNPFLIESFQPFGAKGEKKNHIKLQLSGGFLFASKDNSIKLLRNNII